MRIGVDARFLGASSYGLAQYSENLLTALAEQDSVNEYTVFINANLKRKIRVGQNFRFVKVRGRPLAVKGLVRLDLALRAEEFDIFHSHFPVAPWSARGVPTVVTVHDVVPFQPALAGSRRTPIWDRIGGWFLYPMTMHRARWILCVSHATRERVVELFPNVFHKTIVVRSGVEDIYRQPYDSEAIEGVRQRLGLTDPYLLYSGSCGPTKNVPRMIEAMALLRRLAPRASKHQFVLDITDGARELAEVQRTIARCGAESFTRILTGLSATDRRALFEKADLLFVLSMHEGFCFPAIRAQLCGVPVVAADAGALPEVCGEGSLLVNPENIDEVTTMVSRALFDADLREYLISKGRTSAARFSWGDTAREVRQIYELLF